MKRASALVTEILGSARLDRELPLRSEHVELSALIRAAVERQEAALPEPAGHAIALMVPDSVAVSGDPSRLDQVITNLLTNAVKYSPDGGTIEVRLEPADGRLRLVVVDHGMGIAAEERESVFSPFMRSHAATARGIEGTGLGLYLSKRIVQAHGGTIAVADTPGGGATMIVDLPGRAAVAS